MKEKGLIIDLDGVVTKFGIHNGIGTIGTGHKETFENEIVDTPYFQSLGLKYDVSKTLYTNAENLSREGIMLVFNQQLNQFTSTQLTAYMPTNPTRKQIISLREQQPELDKVEVKKLYELKSEKYEDAKEYSSFSDYLNKKVNIKEKGFVIFEDGTTLPFGIYYCPDEPEYMNSPTHEMDFLYEIEPSITFRLSNYIYDFNVDLYHNALRFSLEGLMIILNNQKSINGPTEFSSFVPSSPTPEQLEALENQQKLLRIEFQNVHEFLSYDFDDYIEYEDLSDYMSKKRIHINKK